MTPWVVFSGKCRVCQALAVWRLYLGPGHLAVTHPSMKVFPSICRREQKKNALTQPSLWCLHDAKMVMWSPPTNQLRWKWRGWWRPALHLSCMSQMQQITDPRWSAIKRSYEWAILIFKRFFSSKVIFLAALRWITAQIQLQTLMSKERWKGYS